MSRGRTLLGLAAWALAARAAAPQANILDLTFHSQVFGEERNFRVFLPPDYGKDTQKRYPVIYFFHGHSERHNRPPRSNAGYDAGDTYGGDNIAAFVGRNDVIVVKWDGSNPRKPGEDYIRPYNISPVETDRQFPLYFPELVRHIDSRFRTIADREHRATAGLSMGGFMSFWIAGKYPHLVGSASNFMGSSEFVVGPKAFPVEYRHDEMYGNYQGLRTRIVLGSRDFIRWYHRRMNAVWDYTRPHHEHEEFDSEHGTPGMAKTLAFHMAAFRDPLPRPRVWSHADVYPAFDVWGWSVESDRRRPGFTVLEQAGAAGFRSSVREWLPGGKLLSTVKLRITTAALYRRGAAYRINDVNLDTGESRQSRQVADSGGRLTFALDGARHEVGIAAAARAIVTVAEWSVAGAPWAVAGKPVRLQLAFLNKGSAAAPEGSATVTSPNPGVRIERVRLPLPPIPAGKRAMVETAFAVDDPRRAAVQLNVRVDGSDIPVVVPLFADAPAISEFQILDGRKLLLWERAVGKARKELGSGNADGVVQAGETFAIAVPGGDAHRAVELFTSDPCVDLSERISDPWSAYDHVGATAKISLARVAGDCAGRELPLYVRYQVPDKPEHILKEGVVRVRVAPAERPQRTESWLGSLAPIARSIQRERGFPMDYRHRGAQPLEQWRRRGRAAVESALSYRPKPVPLDIKVHAVHPRDGYEIRVISFAASAHYRVPAYLLVPARRDAKLPALVALHDHGGWFYHGKEKLVRMEGEHAALKEFRERYYGGRAYAGELARRGFAVIVPDAFYWGERRMQYEQPPVELVARLKGLEPAEPRYVAAMNTWLRERNTELNTWLAFSGTTWMGIVNYDDRRAVDVLASLPEVDPARIGCLGLSGGGYRATYLTGMEPRIRASVITGWMTSLPTTLDIPYPVHAALFDAFSAHANLDHPDIAALAAPHCAIFVQNCAQDRLFTRAGMEAAAAKIRSVYADLKHPERFRAKFYNVPHQFNREMQEEAFAWLEQHLGRF
ncbi:MAG: alpha/beta hydrolase-fold protein [Bryobacteraceae bacterium]